MTLDLTPDQLLSTTRAVRKRLDFDRPVPRELIEECVDLATQAPTGRNRQRWHFLVVTDGPRRRELADIFRRALVLGEAAPLTARDMARMNVDPRSTAKVFDGLRYLADNIHRVPAFVIPAVEGRTDRASVEIQAGTWGSILPAVWSFMLAARARGLGTVWTTAQAPLERELAAVLGVPLRQGDAGRVPAAGLHSRHRLQARGPRAPRRSAALAAVVRCAPMFVGVSSGQHGGVI